MTTGYLDVVFQKELAPNIFEMILKGKMVQDMEAGQFLHLRVPDSSMLLRRPISICQFDKKEQLVHLVYRVEGGGTAIFSQLSAGDQLDVMGPQGTGFPLEVAEKGETALLIGGGIGVPPLVQLAKELAEKGVSVTSVLGFASKDAVILEKALGAYGQVYVTTDDGSYGKKGNVSTVIEEKQLAADVIYACGAPGMLRYVDKTFQNHPKAYISMESRMACGMGACYACVVPVKNGTQDAYKRVCEEGPVFRTGELNLDGEVG